MLMIYSQVFRALANLLELLNYSLTFYIYCLFSEDFRNTLLRTLNWPWFGNKTIVKRNGNNEVNISFSFHWSKTWTHTIFSRLIGLQQRNLSSLNINLQLLKHSNNNIVHPVLSRAMVVRVPFDVLCCWTTAIYTTTACPLPFS